MQNCDREGRGWGRFILSACLLVSRVVVLSLKQVKFGYIFVCELLIVDWHIHFKVQGDVTFVQLMIITPNMENGMSFFSLCSPASTLWGYCIFEVLMCVTLFCFGFFFFFFIGWVWMGLRGGGRGGWNKGYVFSCSSSSGYAPELACSVLSAIS